MIVRTLKEARETNRRVESATWESTRLLLKNDNMGFSFHITRIFAHTETRIHYQNHLESVYCIRGKGEIESLDSGEIHPILPGTIYILDKHDLHLLRAEEELELACVFNPPLNGKEVHNADGAYPLEAEVVSD
ncbi:MAG: ectoine synthase [Hahellaceae bacterium]|nr:ectoine synthase [Hahellaceae bacterium]MCP5168182.1 ectoine synthase [Hahellaceae bacterium]